MRAALFHPYSIRITTTVLCLLLLGVLTTAEQGLSNWRQGNALASGSAAAGAVQVLYIPITIAMCHAYSNTCFLAHCQDQATAFHLSDLAYQEDRPRDQL